MKMAIQRSLRIPGTCNFDGYPMNVVLHVTQDDHGFWMVCSESASGTLSLEAYQIVSRAHAIEDADHLVGMVLVAAGMS